VSNLSARNPVRADHRFIRKLINVSLRGKVVPVPSELSRVSRVFCRLGGSWERVFHGSIEDIVKLRLLLKFAYKNGYLTKKEKWL